MSEKNKMPSKGRGRPRLQDEPCTIRIGLPLTVSDHRALEILVERDKLTKGKRSKQEVIRDLIRVQAETSEVKGG